MSRFVIINDNIVDLDCIKVMDIFESCQLLNRLNNINKHFKIYLNEERELLHLPQESQSEDHLKAIKELTLMRN